MSHPSEPQRILQVHNRYSPGWGGEETVADLEAALLRQHGHEVERLLVSTAQLKTSSVFRQMAAVPAMLWSWAGYKAVKEAVAEFSPDIVHVHNTFPLLSSSVFWAAHDSVPVVQTLHNFRYTCAASVLLRDDKPCEDCVGRYPWAALRHRCYANSLGRTAILTLITGLHWYLGTFTKKVDAYVALSEFSKDIFVRAGLPVEKVFTKPNFVPAPIPIESERLPQIVFVGALSRQKGVHVLLEAWKRIAPNGVDLLIIGDGPERALLENAYRQVPGVIWCGRRNREEIMHSLAVSRFVVLPSLGYENCPMVLLEALSVGTPVMASDHGGCKSIMPRQLQELLFKAGDVNSLAVKISTALMAADDVWRQWSQNAAAAYVQKFSEACGYEQLMAVYRKAMQRFQLRVAIRHQGLPNRIHNRYTPRGG
jgi:glycosyltransferase involved in cell wall biosynthesis